MKNRFYFFANIILLMLYPKILQSQNYILSLEELYQVSRQTVVVNYYSTHIYLDEINKRVFTDYILKIDQVINGDLEKNSLIKITVPGGILNGYITFVPEIPVFNENEEYLLFLEEKKADPPYNRRFVVTGFHQGKFNIAIDKKTGLKIVYRDFVDTPLYKTKDGDEILISGKENINLTELINVIKSFASKK